MLTDERREKILQLIRAGNYRETACAAVGIDSRTMRIWLKRGAKGEKPYASFCAAMEEAEASAEARHVLTLTSASKEDWRAAAWILSRKYSDRWGERVKIDQDKSKGDAQLNVPVAELAGVLEAAGYRVQKAEKQDGGRSEETPDDEG